MQPLSFISKAQNLFSLQSRLKSAKILPLFITSLEQIQDNQTSVLKSIQALAQGNADAKLIVRSSSKSEDSAESSNAGAFLSLANVSVESHVLLEALRPYLRIFQQFLQVY